MVMFCLLGVCFVSLKNIIGLMNRGKKWCEPKAIWFAFACDYDIVLLDNFNTVSCEDCYTIRPKHIAWSKVDLAGLPSEAW